MAQSRHHQLGVQSPQKKILFSANHYHHIFPFYICIIICHLPSNHLHQGYSPPSPTLSSHYRFDVIFTLTPKLLESTTTSNFQKYHSPPALNSINSYNFRVDSEP
ncbi:hypothetical protein PGB90_002794 [Kerria lacca]